MASCGFLGAARAHRPEGRAPPSALPRACAVRRRRDPSRDVAAAGRAAARLRGCHGRPVAAVGPAERGAGAQVGAEGTVVRRG